MGIKIRQLRPGKWYLVVNYQGKRKTKLVGESYAEALAKREQLEAWLKVKGSAALAIFDKPEKSKAPDLSTFKDEWLAELEKSDLKPTTRASYSNLMRLHIEPKLGSLPVDKITYRQVKQLVVEKAETLSRNTCRLIVATLRACLQEAIREGWITANPAQGLGRFYKSATKKESADPFTQKELSKIFEGARKHTATDYAALFLMHRTGMRVGEVRALEVADIDFEAGDAYIYRNWPTTGKLSDTTKTGRTRHVHLDSEVLNVLRQHLAGQRERLLKKGRARRAWLFLSPEGHPLTYRNFYRRFATLQERVKVRVRGFHSLRDTFASERLAEGRSVLWVADQLGNKPATVLQYYAKWIPSEEMVEGRKQNANRRKRGVFEELGKSCKLLI